MKAFKPIKRPVHRTNYWATFSYNIVHEKQVYDAEADDLVTREVREPGRRRIRVLLTDSVNRTPADERTIANAMSLLHKEARLKHVKIEDVELKDLVKWNPKRTLARKTSW